MDRLSSFMGMTELLCGGRAKPIKPFGGNKQSRSGVSTIVASSTMPAAANESQNTLSGDSSILRGLGELKPYQPILPFEVLLARLGRKPEDIVNLDANENPDGPPPEVFDALGNMLFPYIYPDPESRRLRAALAQDAQDSGLESEYILAGCGADELIDLIMRCILDPGDKIVDFQPKFTIYEFDAAINGGLVIKVPRKQDFSLDVEGIFHVVEHEKPKCIFLTSPNNPDGSIIDDETLLKVLKLPVLVVLDEACIEFSGVESRVKWVKKYENLIVLRTFSERAGSPGLRVSYGPFPLSIIQFLCRAKQPYNVSVTSAYAALKNYMEGSTVQICPNCYYPIKHELANGEENMRAISTLHGKICLGNSEMSSSKKEEVDWLPILQGVGYVLAGIGVIYLCVKAADSHGRAVEAWKASGCPSLVTFPLTFFAPTWTWTSSVPKLWG